MRDKTFKFANHLKYDGYQTGLASMFYKFFDEIFCESGIANEPNNQLANDLHKPLFENSKK